MQIDVTSRIDSIRDDWKKLQSQGGPYLFQTIEWVEHWLHTAGALQRIKPFLLSIRQKKNYEPVLILPLGIRTIAGIRILTFLGGFHADYSGIVKNPNLNLSNIDLWEVIIDEAKKNHVDGVWIRNIPSEVGGRPNPLNTQGCTLLDKAPSINLTGSWEDFYNTRIKTKVRADSRRQRKRLSELGSLSFRVAKSNDEAMILTKIMVAQKQFRYDEMGIKNQFKDQANIDFYVKCGSDRKGPSPHISALFLNDRVLSVHWGEVFNGRFYYLMPSHDPEWDKYSPGRLLLEHLIEWSFTNNLNVFDFTVGGEAYKYDWATHEMPLYEYKHALTEKGMIFLKFGGVYKDRIRQGIQMIKKRLFNKICGDL